MKCKEILFNRPSCGLVQLISVDNESRIKPCEDGRISIPIIERFWRENGVQSSRIGVVVSRNRRLIVPLILSTIPSNAVCCLPWGANEEIIEEYLRTIRLRFLISDQELKITGMSLALQEADSLFIYRVDEESLSLPLPILYTVRTSGSTGEPKTVDVPSECILSNIRKLKEILRISPEDVILSCSPPTFDPFYVDVLLSTCTGAKLLILDDFARDFVTRTAELFSKGGGGGATVLQVTPSVFKVLSREEMNFLFSRHSSLRVLCFGGESFPEDLLRSLRIDDSKEIYNIYGITEISCWSSIRRWTRGTEAMDIGEPIDDEVFEIRNERWEVLEEGELWIGSKSRKCLINDEDVMDSQLLFRPTGDLVERRDGRIYYKGRLGDVIKHFGVKVDLKLIEREVMGQVGVENSCCVFDEKAKLIFLFYSSSDDRDLSEQLTNCIKDKGMILPDEIVRVKTLPITSHGKVSQRMLLQGIKEGERESVKSIRDSFQGLDWSRSFQANGGTSIQALQILNKISDAVSFPNLVQMLLNSEISIQEVLRSLESKRSLRIHESYKPLVPVIGSKSWNLNWKYDLNKCVDASPTVFLHEDRPCVAVGSHSHQLVVLHIASGELISKVLLPDRIESKIVVDGDHLFLGCYDENFYSIDLIKGTINWSSNVHGMIKSEVVIAGDLLIFGNYSQEDNLVALNKCSGEKVWGRKIGSKGILSRVVVLDDNELIAAPTLDGTIAILKIQTGELVSSYKLTNPIFTSPILIDSHLIVSEVSGSVHCFTAQLKHLWSFEVSGNIFSSFEVEGTSGMQWVLYFGCHDQCLYKLQLNYNGDGGERILGYKLLWRRQLNAPIMGKPRIYGKNSIICCTTKGSVVSVNRRDGIVNWEEKIDGEIFSSPEVHKDWLMFGSRDDLLYCWKLSGGGD